MADQLQVSKYRCDCCAKTAWFVSTWRAPKCSCGKVAWSKLADEPRSLKAHMAAAGPVS